jgi:cysteine-rich repeat protein
LANIHDGDNSFDVQFGTSASERLSWATVRIVGVETVDAVIFDSSSRGNAMAHRLNVCGDPFAVGTFPPTPHGASVEVTLYEECDDGNQLDNDGCSATCLRECANGRLCGNGRVDGGEECDDGNVVAGDGCSSTCSREP